MPRLSLYIIIAGAIVLAVAIPLIALVALSGGDDDDDDNGGAPTVSVRPTDEPEDTPRETSEPTDDGKTPGPEESPDETEDPGPTPIEATPNPRGIRAVVIEDPAAWFTQNYPGVSPGQEDCSYSVVDVLITCGDKEYAPDPPPVAAGVECFGLLVNNERVALRCAVPDVTTYYYDPQD